MRRLWPLALLVFASCLAPEVVERPPPPSGLSEEFYLFGRAGQPPRLYSAPGVDFTRLLAPGDHLALFRFDHRLSRVFLDRRGEEVILGEVAPPEPIEVHDLDPSGHFTPAAQPLPWTQALGVAVTCPNLSSIAFRLPGPALTSFPGAPGTVYVAYEGGLARWTQGSTTPQLWPQSTPLTAGAFDGARLWVGAGDGRLGILDPTTGAVDWRAATSSTGPIRGMAAAPDSRVVAIDDRHGTWWWSSPGPWSAGLDLDLPSTRRDCRGRPVLLGWWAERSRFLATQRALRRPDELPRALWGLQPDRHEAERLSANLLAITGLFLDTDGGPVLLGNADRVEAINVSTRVLVRPNAGEWAPERPLGIAFRDALAAAAIPQGFVYVGLEGLISTFREYGGTCSPEMILGEGDFEGLWPLDPDHLVASRCDGETTFLIERR